MNRPDIEGIRESWAANTLYVSGDSLAVEGVVVPEYYLVEKTMGDSLLAYITDLEQQNQEARCLLRRVLIDSHCRGCVEDICAFLGRDDADPS